MTRRIGLAATLATSSCLLFGLLAYAQTKKQPPKDEYEKKVKESDVPPAALAALKKLAGGAAITEFAEEFEHGHKYYEGSWKGPDGNVDGLVSETGDVVEIEEQIPMDKVPASVRAELQKAAGKDTTIKVERKTLYVYEGHFKKDGRKHELQFTGEGRRFHENGEKGGDEKDHDDDD